MYIIELQPNPWSSIKIQFYKIKREKKVKKKISI